MVKARSSIRERMVAGHAEQRNQLKLTQEGYNEEKALEFDVKRKELEWLMSMYIDEEEINKIKLEQTKLEMKIQQWNIRSEQDYINQEKILDQREEEEDANLTGLFHLILVYIPKILVR